MQKRFYLSDVIGTGEPDVDEFRPAVAAYPVGWAAASNMADDPRILGWVLVEVNIGNVTPLASDPRIDVLPDVPLSTLLSAVNVGEVAAMRAALSRRGIGIPDVATFGEVITYIKLRAEIPNAMPTIADAEL